MTTTRSTPLLRGAAVLLLALVLPGCPADDDGQAQTDTVEVTDTTMADASDTSVPDTEAPMAFPSDCSRETIEADFASAGPLSGPAVDMETGAVTLPEGAIVTTTYLAMLPTPEAQQAFGEVLGPVLDDLRAHDGVLVSGLGNSMRCGTARTLTVFRDAASMMSFVGGSAHLAAIGRVGEMSRGTSVTDHWEGLDGADVSWSGVVGRLAGHEGPTY